MSLLVIQQDPMLVLTGLLVMVGAGALIAAFWQAAIVRRAARDQLAAYVAVDGGAAGIDKTYPSFVQIHVTLKNAGQTPAHNFTTWMYAEIRDTDDAPFSRRLAVRDRTGSSICLPGSTVNVTAAVDVRVDMAAVRAGAKQIFVWGGADYTDAFRRRWSFKFRSRVAVGVQPPWAIQPHKAGYELQRRWWFQRD